MPRHWGAQRTVHSSIFNHCSTQLLELLNAGAWLIADVRKRTCDEQQLSDTAKLDEHLWNKQCANNEPAIISNFLTSSITSITHLSLHKHLVANELSALVIDVIDDLTKKYSKGLLSLDGREHVLLDKAPKGSPPLLPRKRAPLPPGGGVPQPNNAPWM